MRGLMIDYQTADRIAVCAMIDQLRYLEKEQKWYEADAFQRLEMTAEWGYSLHVHSEDYANNRDKYIPALKTLIEYFGG